MSIYSINGPLVVTSLWYGVKYCDQRVCVCVSVCLAVDLSVCLQI